MAITANGVGMQKSSFKKKMADSGITAADWADLGYNDPPPTCPGDEHPKNSVLYRPSTTTLTNQIYPMFRFENEDRPDGRKDIWIFSKGYPRVRLEVLLLPVLRLASAMMVCPASVGFLYSLLYSSREHLPELTKDTNDVRSFFRRASGVSHGVMRQKVDEALNRLSGSIEISVEDMDVYGRMKSNHEKWGSVAITDDSSRRGVAPKIVIVGKYIVALERLVARKGDNSEMIFALQFMMAKTMCHELSHLIHRAQDPYALHREELGTTFKEMLAEINSRKQMQESKTSIWHDEMLEMLRIAQRISWHLRDAKTYFEPYFEDEEIGELGYSWENNALGGRPIGGRPSKNPRTKGSAMIMFYEWPDGVSSHRYTRGSEPKQYERKYLMSMDFLRRIHQQEFWDAVDIEDTQALFMPKLVYVMLEKKGEGSDAKYVPIGGKNGQDIIGETIASADN